MEYYFVGVHIPTAGEDAFAYVCAPKSIPMETVKELLQAHPDFDGDEVQYIERTDRAAARKMGGDFHETAFDSAFLIIE